MVLLTFFSPCVAQGLLALYHLAAHFLDKSAECGAVVERLSSTVLRCLRGARRNVRDVESIAGNFYLNLWNAATKANQPSGSPPTLLSSFLFFFQSLPVTVP